MKKTLISALSIAALLSITACGSATEPSASPTTTAASESIDAAEASAALESAKAENKAAKESAKAEKEKAKAEAAAKAEKDRAADAAKSQKYADQVYKNWLEARGIKSATEILAESPGSVQGYLVSAESPTTGTVVFTAQVTENEVTKDELKQAAMAVLQLAGFEDESLDRVEIVTADSYVRGVANRSDSPLLNK